MHTPDVPAASVGAAATQPSADHLLPRLAALSKLAARLTRSTNWDELCRNAIILGRQELGFDRLGLWFIGTTPNTITGSYGIDEMGMLRDERQWQRNLSDDFPLDDAMYRKERYAYETDVLLYPLNGVPAQLGWKATAALWNGEQIIGYLFTDNLLTKKPYSEQEGELLALYALLLGHLCTRQRIEEELRQQAATYRALVDAIPDHLLVATRAGTLLDYHAAQPTSLLFPVNPLAQQSVYDLLSPALAAQYVQAIEKVIQTGEVLTLEHPLQLHDQLHYVETRLSASGPDKIVALVRDVTARKALEEQLYAAQKVESLGRMAGGIAHDFNNLLTVIQGFASLAERQAGSSNAKLQHALTNIQAASEKGAQLTHQLLLFARKQVVQPRIVDLNELVSGLTAILTSLLGEAIPLDTVFDPTLGQVQIDPGQFEQVIINLAVNARDAMPQGGQLTIRTYNQELKEPEARLRFSLPAGLYSVIEMSDTGVGIAPELQKQIFDPFFTTKEQGKGTGLGLAICHSIVQQNGGQICLQSTLQQGTTFQIMLPQTLTPMAIRANAPANVSAPGAETILLVEDDEPVRAVAVEMLTSYGYRVLEYAAGADALRTAQEQTQPINLLMTDMMMPEMNGREVAEQFMRLRPGVPVLLVSGHMAEVPEALVRRTDVTFLPKPYSLPVLTKTIRQLLDQPTLR
ncbi:MAG: response regulator [Caldilineaceae bacterium]|nr:response regulator [Caldilineaceae bacterium]